MGVNTFENEIERIQLAYRQRSALPVNRNTRFIEAMVYERQTKYHEILNKYFPSVKNVTLLEIGAGAGANLNFFIKEGFMAKNIFANELLDDRIDALQKNFPAVNVLPGDALNLPGDLKVDIIFQSTVFSSVLNERMRQALADKMVSLLRPGGIILWYDFTYNNPANKQVRGVSLNEIKKMFGRERVKESYKVTLAPPVGRKAGRFYFLLARFRFLRTHLIAVIQ